MDTARNKASSSNSSGSSSSSAPGWRRTGFIAGPEIRRPVISFRIDFTWLNRSEGARSPSSLMTFNWSWFDRISSTIGMIEFL